MNRFRSLATGVALVALLATSVAYAQGPRGGGFGGRGGRGFGPGGPGLALNELNLTDAQREQVSEIRDRYRSRSRRCHGASAIWRRNSVRPSRQFR